MQIAQYTITQSNASRQYQSSVKVILAGCIVAHVRMDSGKPLDYIRKHYHAPERAEFIRQLTAAQVTEDDIKMILKIDVK